MPGSRGPRLRIAAVPALALVISLLPSGTAPASASRSVPARPAGGAAMVGWHEKGDDLDALRAHEAQLGTRFALVRIYQQWQLPSKKVGTLLGEGRLVLVSHKPPATGGWAAVASGAEDGMIAALADRYRSYGAEVLFVFHHEPHDDAVDLKGGTAGTVAEYRAAWQRIFRIFADRGAHHSAGGNVFFAYSATGSWALAKAPGGGPGSGDVLYPGDGIVDVFAHDRYNWASCRGDGWEEFSENWAPLVALAAAHGKPLIAAELGSPPAGGARNDWFRRGAEWLRTDPMARQWMWGLAYYHSMHETCPWDFLNQGDDGLLGWRDGFRDSYFTGTPFSLARSGAGTGPPVAPAPPQPAPPPVPPPVPGGPPPTTPTTRAPVPVVAVPATAPPGTAPPTTASPATAPLTDAAVPAPSGTDVPDTAASGGDPTDQDRPDQDGAPSGSSRAALFVLATTAAALVGRRMLLA